jgi:single-strand DNA-binding protein
MRDINHTIIHGFVATMPQMVELSEGKKKCRFSVGVNAPNDKVHFLNVEFWDKQAQVCQDYLKKGKHVVIQGRLKQNRWADSEGKPRSMVMLNGSRMSFVNRYKRDEQAQS